MKKLICLTLAFLLLLCMAGCKKTESEETPSAPSQEDTKTQEPIQDEDSHDTEIKNIQMPKLEDMYDEWTMESFEVEGYVSDGKDEGIVSTMSFDNTMGEAKVKYSKHSAFSGVTEEFTAETIYLEEPLYTGCGNEEWSVKLMPIDYNNINGVEYYITLTDKDTLLMQRCFMIDGTPGVSYETFKRNK